MEVFFIIRSLV